MKEGVRISLSEPCIFLRGAADSTRTVRQRRRQERLAQHDLDQANAALREHADPPTAGDGSRLPRFFGSANATPRESARGSPVGSGTATPVMSPHTESEVPEQDPGVAILRGLLTVTLNKPTRIRKISARLKGSTRSEWPEGIGPRRLEVSDERILVDQTLIFFDAANSTSQERRSSSLGPSMMGRDEDARGRSAGRSSSVFASRDQSTGTAYHSNADRMLRDSSRPGRSSNLRESSTHSQQTPRAGSPTLSRPSSQLSLRPTMTNMSNHHSSPRLDATHELTEEPPQFSSDSSDNSSHTPPPGARSAPVPSTARSSFEHLSSRQQALHESSASRRNNSITNGLTQSTSRLGQQDDALDRSRSPSMETSPRARRASTREEHHARFSLRSLSAALRNQSRSRSRRDESPAKTQKEDKGKARNESRGRAKGLKALKNALATGNRSGSESDDESEEMERTGRSTGWKEFKPGTYTWAISIPLPTDLPPSLDCGFGTTMYRLKATVTKAGALSMNATTETPIELIATPGDDDELIESVAVARMWETQLHYAVSLNQKSFPIGGLVPITIRLRPMTKLKVYRISVHLEEKITYFAHDRKLKREEGPRRFVLSKVAYEDEEDPLLPIVSTATNALQESPLADWLVNPHSTSDDTAASCMDVLGPWELEASVPVPGPESKLRFSTTSQKSNIAVSHVLKVIIRVDRGDDDFVDGKGKRRKWDIVVESPAHILHSRCNQSQLLPEYSQNAPPVKLPAASSILPYLGDSSRRARTGSGWDPSAALQLASGQGGQVVPDSAPPEYTTAS